MLHIKTNDARSDCLLVDNQWQDTMLPSNGNVTPVGRHTLAEINRDFEQRTTQAPPPPPSSEAIYIYKLSYADKHIVNIVKVYIERNNTQV